MFFKYAFREIRQKLQLKIGEINATLLCQHNSMVHIVNHLFGDGKTSSGPENIREKYNDVTAGAQDINDAVNRINRMLSGR